MTFLVDLDALRSRAHRLDRAAEEIRSRASELQAAADGARWVSMGADGYRAASAALRAELIQVAARIDHAAALLRHHANTADSHLRALTAVPGEVLDGAEHAASWAGGLAVSGLHRLGLR